MPLRVGLARALGGGYEVLLSTSPSPPRLSCDNLEQHVTRGRLALCQVKITDFGLAKDSSVGSLPKTASVGAL